jgi:short-subunit dehydrogenase
VIAAKTVLVLGATSDIGRAIAAAYAGRGYNLVLTGRDGGRLEAHAADLRRQHSVIVVTVTFDILDITAHTGLLEQVDAPPDTVICVLGYAGDQTASQEDITAAELVMRTNYVGPALLLGDIAQRMEQRGSGTIIAISSVTGERGRAKNYVYGSAKAGLTAFLSGLRNRLAGKGIQVVTVKAGWCNTRKSAGASHPGFLTAEPRHVADAVVDAQQNGRDVIYVLPVWRFIMWIVRAIPERVFKRMSF